MLMPISDRITKLKFRLRSHCRFDAVYRIIDTPRFLMNCVIILAQSVLISLGMNAVIASICKYCVFCTVDYRLIRELVRAITKQLM